MMQYILPMARNLRTGQTVQQQDLKGVRYQPHQKTECQLMADRLAQNLSDRTGDQWQAYCHSYSAA